jgi:hypothetical protein
MNKTIYLRRRKKFLGTRRKVMKKRVRVMINGHLRSMVVLLIMEVDTLKLVEQHVERNYLTLGIVDVELSLPSLRV